MKIIGSPIYLTSPGDTTKFWKVLPSIKAGAEILVLGSSGLFLKDKSITDSLNEIKETIDKIK